VGDIIQQIFIGKDSQSQRQEFRNRQALLRQVKNEVDNRLENSLHKAVLINLDKQKQPQQVKNIAYNQAGLAQYMVNICLTYFKGCDTLPTYALNCNFGSTYA